jgi:hypothetical protein
MAKRLSLSSFEKLDGLYGSLVRMGDFMDCADPRGFLSLSNRLLDACLDAGMSYDEPDHVLWAGNAITRALVSA